MAFIEWTLEYATGIPLIDAQHKKLFAVINDYHDSVIGSDTAFNALFAYIDFHFKTEEYYFEKFGYENTASHVAQHRYYEEEIKRLEAHSREGQAAEKTHTEVEEFVRDWIQQHIKKSDRMYQTCFTEHGLADLLVKPQMVEDTKQIPKT